MWLAIKLAYKNLIGAGLRTWLNVIVLSFSFVVIIWLKGVMSGWDHQAKTDMAKWEIGDGQYWHENYDPYDPFTLSESHAVVPPAFAREIESGTLEAVLISQGSIYPEGRIQSVLIKGINPFQTILDLPSSKLDTLSDAVPAIIGSVMARSNNIKRGDQIILRWRDSNGTFDAIEIVIVEIFVTNVPAVDIGQVWIPLEKFREMMLLPREATVFVIKDGGTEREEIGGWKYKSFSELTKQIDEMIKTKTIGQSVFYIILLLLAMLAVFDTQILSIFRRQREIGTYIALGYTRMEVVRLFTVEGAMHAVLAAILAGVYGIPFLLWQAKVGWTLPMDASEFGMAMAQTLYPVYTIGLIVTTVAIILLTTAVVSYLPSRKIAKMNPTEALRGKLQ
jgi:putative ABC transport system permease protein